MLLIGSMEITYSIAGLRHQLVEELGEAIACIVVQHRGKDAESGWIKPGFQVGKLGGNKAKSRLQPISDVLDPLLMHVPSLDRFQIIQ